MDVNSEYPEGSFANPDVDDEIIECIVDYLNNNGKSHPHYVICYVEDKLNSEREDVTKGLRKLKMADHIVPAEPFVGEIKIVN